METASNLKIQNLYHYQPYKLEWLEQTILKNKICLSNPGNFNDPWDCRPYFSLNVDDPNYNKKIKEFLIELAEEVPGEDDAKDQYIHSLKNSNSEELKGLIKEFSGIFVQAYRVRCLTTERSSVLMWGHYAESHKGICLEFDTHKNVFGDAEKVDYVSEYPLFDITDIHVLANTVLITKSKVWKKEKEYRLIVLDKGTKLPTNGMLVAENNFLPIPENSLKAVIMGCMMPESNREQVKDLINKSGKPIQLKEAVRHPNKYELTIEEI